LLGGGAQMPYIWRNNKGDLMKSFSIFFATILVFAQSALAVSLPKTAKVLLALDQPAVVVELPALDLTAATIEHNSMVTFQQSGSIKVGAVTYKMDPVAFVTTTDESKGLTLENIKMIRYRLFSEEMKSVVGDIVVDLKTGSVSMNKSAKGLVTEWY
jgi:hypothetical protein